MIVCPDCTLLRRYGYGDRICLKCASELRKMAKRLGRAIAKQRDKVILDTMKAGE